jgi:endonuclease IV
MSRDSHCIFFIVMNNNDVSENNKIWYCVNRLHWQSESHEYIGACAINCHSKAHHRSNQDSWTHKLTFFIQIIY